MAERVPLLPSQIVYQTIVAAEHFYSIVVDVSFFVFRDLWSVPQWFFPRNLFESC
jgi:hypothetical protein